MRFLRYHAVVEDAIASSSMEQDQAALTHAEIAAQFSEALGKPIAFVEVHPSEMREALFSLKSPEWQADGLVEDYAYYQRGEAASVSSIVEQVTGTPPRAFLNFARDYKQVFLKEPAD